MASLTNETVVDVLRPVQDPELHRSIVELDMVRGVVINGTKVTVTVALTVAGCPMRTEIAERVTQAVKTLPQVEDVEVDLTVMSSDELNGLKEKLGVAGASPSDGGSGHTWPTGRGAETLKTSFNKVGSKTRVISINSGKGGVGKSSVTVNLSIALSQLGYDVGIVDADIYGFSVPKMLDADVQPTVFDEEAKVLLPVPTHGIRIISLGNFMSDDQAVVWRGPMLHQMLREFLARVHWGEPDFLLVDMPPGTGDIPLSVAQYLPEAEVYVVTTPQPAAQRVAQRSAAMARGEQINQPVMGVIENMSWFTGDDGKRYELFGAGGGKALADELDVPLLGQLPFVPALREGGDEGQPVTVADPECEVAFAFRKLAERIVDNKPAPPKQRYRSELKINQ